MNKIKIFCFTFLMTLMLGGTMSVFASETKELSFVYNDVLQTIEYDSLGNDVVVLKSDYYAGPLLTVSTSDSVSFYATQWDSPMNSHYYIHSVKKDDHSKNTQYNFLFNADSGAFEHLNTVTDYLAYDRATDEIICSTNDILYSSNDSVFFQKTPEKVKLLKGVRELPPAIFKSLKPIVIIAVSCLGLLISCLVLLPRLRNFLHF